MHLVQLLIPTYDNRGEPFPASEYARLREELTDAFGGLTAYTRVPAQGLWQEGDSAQAKRDDIVVYEVMVRQLDRLWWASYRQTLERRFVQDELVIRAQVVERL